MRHISQPTPPDVPLNGTTSEGEGSGAAHDTVSPSISNLENHRYRYSGGAR